MFWKSDIAAKGRRYADTNEVERSNILAPGLPSGTRRTHLLPAFTPEWFRGLALGSRIQLQQRNCSRFARDFSRRSTFSRSQRTESISSDFSLAAQDLFRICPGRAATNRRPRATIEPSRVSTASSSAKAWTIALRFSVGTIAPARYRK
jgi:hypothetical protein